MAITLAEAGGSRQSRRPAGRVFALLAALVLAGCQAVVPRTGPPPVAPRPVAPPISRPVPRPENLPQDSERNRVALLVPTTGPNAAVGQSIANAANLAIIDTGGQRVRMTVYDTGPGAGQAAERALADGNRLILGPLLGEDVAAVAAPARRSSVPVVSFTNDVSVAGDGVFAMGFVPDQAIVREVEYAKSRGLIRLGALVPAGTYGRRSSNALLAAAREAGVTVASLQSFDRSPASLAAAAAKLGPKGSLDAVLIADTGRMALQAAPLVRKVVGPVPRLLGTELWNTDVAVLDAAPALAGAWYASVPDENFRQLAAKYRVRFGRSPYRLASLGYDAVLLTVRIAADWRPGDAFPLRALTDRGGFAGIDGAFRFGRDNVAERALQVTQVGPKGPTVVSAAPAGFGG